MATTTIYHVQASDSYANGDHSALLKDSMCEILAYLPTVNFDKVCSFPLIWSHDTYIILDQAFAVTNGLSKFNELNEWFDNLRATHSFRSGSQGDLYIIQEPDSQPEGYLCLPNGWQKINCDPVKELLSSAILYKSTLSKMLN